MNISYPNVYVMTCKNNFPVIFHWGGIFGIKETDKYNYLFSHIIQALYPLVSINIVITR